MPQPKVNPAILEARRKASIVKRVFSTPEGQDALQILIDQFGGSCYCKGDPHHTAYLEGGRDVLIYIRQLMQAKSNPESIDGT